MKMKTICDGPWTYFAEGGANVLYHNEQLQGKLLRLRKNKPGRRPSSSQSQAHSPSTCELYDYICDRLTVLQEFMVPVELVRVDRQLTQRLDLVDKHEEYGLLVDHVGYVPGLSLIGEHTTRLAAAMATDRAFRRDGDGINDAATVHSCTIEFKPKWLLQSPTAPADARLCRTCALRKLRKKPASFCPLELVSKNDQVRHKAVQELVDGHEHKFAKRRMPLAHVLDEFCRHTRVFDTLVQLQANDRVGVLNGHTSAGFDIAMTARDVTLLVEIFHGHVLPDGLQVGEYSVRGRLIDLDMKRYHGKKLLHLVDTENALIDGFYR